MKKYMLAFNFVAPLKKVIITLSLILSTLLVTAQNQIVNPGFEDGDSVNVDGWIMDLFGSHRNTQYVNSGTYSLAVHNWYSYVTGTVTNGEGTTQGTPINVLPASLSGYYLYDTLNTISYNDSAIVSVTLKKYDAVANLSSPVASGFLKLEGTDMSSGFQPFEVLIDNIISTDIPDTIVVSFSSSGGAYCMGGECLYFYVDDLSLALPLGINVPFNPTTGIEFWPNPIQDKLHIKLSDSEQGIIEIFKLNGQLVHSQIVYNGQILNLEKLSHGSYLVSIEYNGKREVHKLVK